jgi:hypothetical protein
LHEHLQKALESHRQHQGDAAVTDEQGRFFLGGAPVRGYRFRGLGPQPHETDAPGPRIQRLESDADGTLEIRIEGLDLESLDGLEEALRRALEGLELDPHEKKTEDAGGRELDDVLRALGRTGSA